MMLAQAKAGQKAIIQEITGNEKLKRFLFSLGCSEGQEIALISILAGNYIINVKDSRYAIDRKMAEIIKIN
ncbi:MAG TPA: ferrous iron transport protein A [Clostridiales bacterium]|jgi:ferrous iron transport protein A|nr:ferrous iron transport protein A [Clostridiales bacterium]